ncbi:MAG: STAS domain-containing protein [Planctomycetota bacterium]|nr:STAS domain-containing protein [Planctomycetota bacterium]
MNALQTLFEVSYLTDTLLLVPTGNLNELHFQEIEHEGDEILELLDNGDARHVVVDFGNTEYCGSSALSYFIRIWKHVRAQRSNGRVPFIRKRA